MKPTKISLLFFKDFAKIPILKNNFEWLLPKNVSAFFIIGIRFSALVHLLKAINKNIKAKLDICSKLMINMAERSHLTSFWYLYC